MLTSSIHKSTFKNYSILKTIIPSTTTTTNTRPLKLTPLRSFYSTTIHNLEPVSLAFDHYLPTGELQTIKSENPIRNPIIILHGLFGSRRNWRTLAKRISQNTNREVFVLDLRNHGESPGTLGKTTYFDYASDIEAFIDENRLENVNLIGHSMGGKVAMTVALNPNGSSIVNKLMVVDISPMKGKISDEFVTYLNGMKEINSMEIKNRKEADQILSKFEKDIEIRQFILTNLKKINHQYKIQLSLEALTHQILNDEVGDFPFSITENHPTFQKPTIFIKGKSSKYINKYSFNPIINLFPNYQLIEFDAGHWVHAEKPKEFLETVTEFMNKNPT